jgi:hypothetical protein
MGIGETCYASPMWALSTKTRGRVDFFRGMFLNVLAGLLGQAAPGSVSTQSTLEVKGSSRIVHGMASIERMFVHVYPCFVGCLC